MSRSERFQRVLAPFAYFFSGLVVGIGPFQEIAQRLGVRAGFGTFVVINGMLPLIAAILAILRPRPGSAAIGGLLLTLGFLLGAMMRREPLPWHWTAAMLRGTAHPILLAATIGYAFLGVVVAWLVASLRHKPA